MKTTQNPSRRHLIATGAAVATGTLAFGMQDAAGAATRNRSTQPPRSTSMTSNTITTQDGTQIF